MEPSLTMVEGFTAVGLAAADRVFLAGVEMIFFTTFFFVPVGGAVEAPISLAKRDMSSGIMDSTREVISAGLDRPFSTAEFSRTFLVACSSSLPGFFFWELDFAVFFSERLSEEDLVSLLSPPREAECLEELLDLEEEPECLLGERLWPLSLLLRGDDRLRLSSGRFGEDRRSSLLGEALRSSFLLGDPRLLSWRRSSPRRGEDPRRSSRWRSRLRERECGRREEEEGEAERALLLCLCGEWDRLLRLSLCSGSWGRGRGLGDRELLFFTSTSKVGYLVRRNVQLSRCRTEFW